MTSRYYRGVCCVDCKTEVFNIQGFIAHRHHKHGDPFSTGQYGYYPRPEKPQVDYLRDVRQAYAMREANRRVKGQ